MNLSNFVLDMLRYLDLYIVVLDEEMKIKFYSKKLQNDLSVENMEDRCWLDFIGVNERDAISHIHDKISNGENLKKYQEVINDIISTNGRVIKTKWFNAQINHTVKWTFSFGLPIEEEQNQSLESIRSYYKDIINQDRTVIESVRDIILNGVKREDRVCLPQL